MEVKTLNYLKDYAINERFITEATLYPKYQLARVIAQYRGKYRVVTEHGEVLHKYQGK